MKSKDRTRNGKGEPGGLRKSTSKLAQASYRSTVEQIACRVDQALPRLKSDFKDLQDDWTTSHSTLLGPRNCGSSVQWSYETLISATYDKHGRFRSVFHTMNVHKALMFFINRGAPERSAKKELLEAVIPTFRILPSDVKRRHLDKFRQILRKGAILHKFLQISTGYLLVLAPVLLQKEYVLFPALRDRVMLKLTVSNRSRTTSLAINLWLSYVLEVLGRT